MIFYRYDDDGKYLARVHATEDSLAFENSLRIHIGDADMRNDFHDLATGQPTPKGDQPSEVHTFDYTLKQWVDARTLQETKDQKWAVIKTARSAAEFSGFTWNALVFDSDNISQQRIAAAVILASLNSTYAVDWTIKNNTVHTLTATNLLAVGQALGAHVTAQFSKTRQLRVLIEAATTKAEVELISWTP